MRVLFRARSQEKSDKNEIRCPSLTQGFPRNDEAHDRRDSCLSAHEIARFKHSLTCTTSGPRMALDRNLSTGTLPMRVPLGQMSTGSIKSIRLLRCLEISHSGDTAV